MSRWRVVLVLVAVASLHAVTAFADGYGVITSGVDNRVPSRHPGIARVLSWPFKLDPPFSCTAWATSSGVWVTAAHCVIGMVEGTCENTPLRSDFKTIEFEVRKSEPDGRPKQSIKDNTFDVDPKTVKCMRVPASANTPGLSPSIDWALFRTTVSPFNRLRSLYGDDAVLFYRAIPRELKDQETPKPALRLTIAGYGLAGPDPCFGSALQHGCNTTVPKRTKLSQTQQEAAGLYYVRKLTGNKISDFYTVDTQAGNSGSPVVEEGTDVAIAIHTDGFEGKSGDVVLLYNWGTSFAQPDLRRALQTYPALMHSPAFDETHIVYADADSPVGALPTGNYFAPYTRLADALATAVEFGDGKAVLVSAVSGTYGERIDEATGNPENITLKLTNSVYLEMPVGDVTLWGEVK